jgi:inosine-uridine nucleoside N-ribohydrolase
MPRQRTPPAPLRLVLDTDPGIDDAVAIALAARSPEVRLAAVTTSYGNAPLALSTRNARVILNLAGRSDVPVFPGSERPLTAAYDANPVRHGPTGLGHATVPPDVAAGDVPGDRGALLHALSAQPPTRSTVLVTLGPLTNLAAALDADAALVRDRLALHLAMASPPADADEDADFNTLCDPEAADRVLAANLPTSLVPLAVSRRVRLDPQEVATAAASPEPLTRTLGDAVRFLLELWRGRGVCDCPVSDAAVVAGAIRPGLLDFSPRELKIGGRRIPVANSVDADAARALIARVLPIARA